MDGGAWRVPVPGVARVGHYLATKPLPPHGSPGGSCCLCDPGTAGTVLGTCLRVLERQLAPTPRAPAGGVLLPRSSRREAHPYDGLAPLPGLPPYLSGGPSLLPSTPSVATLQPLQAIFMRPAPVLFLGLTSET